MVTGTTKQLSTKYLSLDAPDPSTATCIKVPVAVTGTFLADLSGVWSTNSAFDPPTAAYQLTMTGTTVSETQYSNAMRNLTEQVHSFGTKTDQLDVIGQQIAFSFFRALDPQYKLTLQADAQLGIILKRLNVAGARPVLSSAAGVCLSSLLTPSWDDKRMILTVPFPDKPPPSAAPTVQPTTAATTSKPTAGATTNSSSSSTRSSSSSSGTSGAGASSFVYGDSYEYCPGQISVGHSTLRVNSATPSIDIDMASTALAFALNFGIIGTTGLTPVLSVQYQLGYDGSDSSGGTVYKEDWAYDYYPGMEAVRCFSKDDQPRVCLARYGSTYVFPG